MAQEQRHLSALIEFIRIIDQHKADLACNQRPQIYMCKQEVIQKIFNLIVLPRKKM